MEGPHVCFAKIANSLYSLLSCISKAYLLELYTIYSDFGLFPSIQLNCDLFLHCIQPWRRQFFAHLRCVKFTTGENTNLEQDDDGDDDEDDDSVVKFPLHAHDISKKLITPFVKRANPIKETFHDWMASNLKRVHLPSSFNEYGSVASICNRKNVVATFTNVYWSSFILA
ncbi:hypothetical protein AAHA92_19515 [Salvia divinorum]|uniref:Uncharacterized protein n=1 Tax=Salvia divinorum TaxID=28513 RepID=A0ABD1H5M1_SALDI